MIANYGYEDASGNYYITINTDLCTECETHDCINICPEKIFRIETDDYDDDVAIVIPEVRNSLKSVCTACKCFGSEISQPPCLAACVHNAIKHSW
jgi:ferredoxin-like protein FixX